MLFEDLSRAMLSYSFSDVPNAHIVQSKPLLDQLSESTSSVKSAQINQDGPLFAKCWRFQPGILISDSTMTSEQSVLVESCKSCSIRSLPSSQPSPLW